MKENGSRSPIHLLLTLLPGAAVSLLTLARFGTGGPLGGLEVVPLLLCALLVAAGLSRPRPDRRIALWSLPALGYLLVGGFPLLGGLLPPGSGSQIFTFFWFFWLLASAGAAAILLWQQQRSHPLPLAFWLLPGLALLVQPSVIVLGGLLFLPAALALRLARQHGGRAALLLAPALYWLADGLLEPAYAIRIWQGSEQAARLLTLLPPVLFLLLLPTGFVLSRSRRQQIAIIGAVPVCLLAAELWRSSFFAGTAHGGYDVGLWLVRGGTILQHTLLLLWIFLAGRHLRQEQGPPHRQPALAAR